MIENWLNTRITAYHNFWVSSVRGSPAEVRVSSHPAPQLKSFLFSEHQSERLDPRLLSRTEVIQHKKTWPRGKKMYKQPPRLVFISTALDFIIANWAGPNKFFVVSLRGQVTITTSDSRRSCSKGTCSPDTSTAIQRENILGFRYFLKLFGDSQ